MAYRLALAATATSDSGGNITFKFSGPGTGLVYTGTVFVDKAPSTLASRVTVGGVPWGSSTGGQALQVQAVESDEIDVIASGAAPTTSYTAWLTGSSSSAEETASQGYIYPFPAPPAANPGGPPTPVVPGNVIGFSSYAPAVTVNKTPTATLLPVDAAHINVTFVAPASGKVIIYLSCLCFADTSASAFLMAWGVLDHTSAAQYGPAIIPIQSINNTIAQTTRLRAIIPIYIQSGLTAGTTYTVDFAYIGNTGNANTLTYGANIAATGGIAFASSIDMLVSAA